MLCVYNINELVHKRDLRRCLMRRKNDTLQETLLDLARQVVETEGIDAINIRSLAGRAGVATGTVYNYFANKDEILLALTEEYWRQTLFEMNAAINTDSFCEQLKEMYGFLDKRIKKSAGKLMKSLGNVGTAGLARMASMQSELESTFIQSMEQDVDVRSDVWNETFTKEQFARFIMMNMLLLLRTEASDMDFLIMIIRRTIY